MSTTGPPNLLLIIADDLGKDVTRIRGNGSNRRMVVRSNDGTTDIVRPLEHVSRLLRNGLNFGQAWAQPACSPTRASIFTGLHPWKTGVGSPLANPTLAPEADFTTIPELLPGYSCGLFGKWHLGLSAGAWPTDHGWHKHVGTLKGVIGQNAADWENWDKYDSDDYTVTPGAHTTSTVYATRDTVEEAGAWINGLAADTPWFVTIAFHTPHDPYHVPPGGWDATTPGDPTSEAYMYNLMVQNMDANIGRLLGAQPNPPIQAIPQDQLENTLIVFIGDNGSHQPVALEEWKTQIYEGGVRVPMIISDGRAFVQELNGQPVSPNFLEPGKLNRTSPRVVHVVDLYKTLVRAADPSVAFPADTDSRNLTRFFTLPGARPPVRDYNFSQWYHTAGGQLRATIRNDDYKLNYDVQLPDPYSLYEYSGGEVPGLEETTAINVYAAARSGADPVAETNLLALHAELLANYEADDLGTPFPPLP